MQRLSFPLTFRRRRDSLVQKTAKTLYRALGCRGLARVDMFLKEDGSVLLNEVNTLPGLTSYSRYPRMMAAAGLPLSEVIDRDRVAGIGGKWSMKRDFVFVDESVPGIRWDAKYATWDNFTGKPVDGYLANRIVGTMALCAALQTAQAAAASLGFGLLLWDGYRPQSAVECFLRWSKRAEDGRKKLRHYPNIDRPELFEKGYVAPQSGHSRGSTVDLTLFHLVTGELAPMGGGHDLMDPISHHGAKGITSDEARNREISVFHHA